MLITHGFYFKNPYMTYRVSDEFSIELSNGMFNIFSDTKPSDGYTANIFSSSQFWEEKKVIYLVNDRVYEPNVVFKNLCH